MSPTLYACAYAAEFPTQALLRLRPDLQSEPVAVLEGRLPLELVCSMNKQARLKGAVPGMKRMEVEQITGIRLVTRSLESEAAARSVFIECSAHFSPRIENTSKQMDCACVLDIAGVERLFGPPEMLAQRLRASLAAAGFRASIAISANFHTARLKALSSRTVTVIPSKQEAIALEKLPVALLGLEEEHAETLAMWGIRTLGELAALPEIDLVARLGEKAKLWRDLARGTAQHTFQPIEPEFTLKELTEFDTPVERSESLLFVCARMIDCLVARAASRALSLASLTIQMQLEGGFIYRRIIRPALPTVDRKFLLKLLQLEIAAHPPQSAVLQVVLIAEAGQSKKVQLGLFSPQMPEPSQLDVTIARLKAIAGEDRVGSPVLEDTHRPGSFHVESFAVVEEIKNTQTDRPRAALRRMRPSLPARVVLRADKPTAFRAAEQRFTIKAAYGPWRTNGCWWSSDGWDAEEWDVLAQPSNGTEVACLLVRDCTQNTWRLEAFYD